MAELRDRLGAALGPAYRVDNELGGGGMSRVFLAQELRLGRRVVVKVLPPEMAAGVSVERFEREIQLAAKLQHPHIVPLLSAGASDDLLYYIMPYVEGESLRTRLGREGELPMTEALQVLRDVLDALAYAHRHHVVHRDIKPDNVLLSEGHALVTDFGVAKAVAPPAGQQGLTSTGLALGTPLYMAPEQAAGDPQVDQRADLYALGVLAYEMLCGRTPFAGPNPQAVFSAHLTQMPEPCTTYRPTVPRALNDAVLRCLEKHPADRWQRAEELQRVLEALLTPADRPASDAVGAPAVAGGEPAAAEAGTRASRVAGLFVLIAIGVLTTVYAAVRVIGLPDWVSYGAVALLVAGVPITALTARHERRRALARSSGRVTATPPGIKRHLTWRNVIAGGGLAFTALAVVAALFMALRLWGVGPFATLLSTGVLKKSDLLVLADFGNRTSDSTLAASVTEAIRVDLTRSPVIRLVEGNDVVATLRRMQRDPAAGLPEALAREVAEREGAKAVVAGDVRPLGSGYVLAARVMNGADGATLFAIRETAADAAGIIPAVDRLSRGLREHIGESLRSIRAAPPLERVTTGSLAALRAFSEGTRLLKEGRQAQALPHFQQATALDSSFGMAWYRVGVILFNAGGDRSEMLDALRRADALSDRMPPTEAAFASALYAMVLGDGEGAISAYKRLLATSADSAGRNNLAMALITNGRSGEAEPLARRAVALHPENGMNRGTLLEVLTAEGNDAAADSVLAVWANLAPRSVWRQLYAAAIARDRSRFALALVYADSVIAAGSADGYPARAEILSFQGRLRESWVAAERALALMETSDTFGLYLPTLVWGALRQTVLLGVPDVAMRRVEAGLRSHPLDSLAPANRPYGSLVYFYTTARAVDRAQGLAAEYQRLVPRDVREIDGQGRLGLARLALARGDGRVALTGFRRARELLNCWLCTDFDQAQAFEQLGMADSAMVLYEQFVNGRRVNSEQRDLYLAPALRRVGELYEAKGNRDKALEYYGRFVGLWKDADPELQPLVRDVKQRMVRLAGER